MIILEIIAYTAGFAIGSGLFFYLLDKKEKAERRKKTGKENIYIQPQKICNKKGMKVVRKFAKVIARWKMEAHLDEPIMYDVNYDTKEILIYTTRPGWLIGKAGCLVNKYTEIMKEEWPVFKGFKFKETRDWVY